MCIYLKTNSYVREVPTCFFQKNFHKQIKTARSPPRNGSIIPGRTRRHQTIRTMGAQ
nr:MAG TPA: hypothetical protein [Bacteriophage sp.]